MYFRLLPLFLLLLGSFLVTGFTPAPTQASEGNAKYIGKEGCRECHTKLYKSYEDLFRRGQKKPRRLPHSTDILGNLKEAKKSFAESQREEGHSKYKTKEKQRVNLAKLDIDWEKDYSKDGKCLKCHATGYGTESGYDPKKPNRNLSGVTCEACHGAASKYVPYMEKAAEKYQRVEALKYGMIELHKDNGKKSCVDTCHQKTDDCPIIRAVDDYSFDWEKRRHKAHDSKTGGW